MADDVRGLGTLRRRRHHDGVDLAPQQLDPGGKCKTELGLEEVPAQALHPPAGSHQSSEAEEGFQGCHLGYHQQWL